MSDICKEVVYPRCTERAAESEERTKGKGIINDLKTVTPSRLHRAVVYLRLQPELGLHPLASLLKNLFFEHGRSMGRN